MAQECDINLSPFSCVDARPQSNNEIIDFTRDVCAAAVKLDRDVYACNCTNVAVDGVSLATKYFIATSVKFLSGTNDYVAGVDNKHCINNYRYQIFGGSCAAIIGNYTPIFCFNTECQKI